MQLGSFLTVVKLFTILRLEYDRHTLRPQLDAVNINNPLFSINLTCCGSIFTYTALASHPKAKHLTLNEQIWPGPTSMGMEAHRGFYAVVLATITDTSAANYEFQTINCVSVDSPEEMVSSRPSSTASCSRTRSSGASRTPKADGGQLWRTYEAFMVDIRLYQLEEPLQDCEFMVFKSMSHFVAL